jgi:hypothetical protein
LSGMDRQNIMPRFKWEIFLQTLGDVPDKINALNLDRGTGAPKLKSENANVISAESQSHYR